MNYFINIFETRTNIVPSLRIYGSINMRRKGYLLIAGSLNFLLAAMHLIVICVGAPAYYFLDAPQLAVYSELGFIFPAWLTLMLACAFVIFGLYAFCGAGSKIKLPFQNTILKIIGTLFMARGLVVFWFIYYQIRHPLQGSLKEIVFSVIALMMGWLFWSGTKETKLNESL